MRWACSTHGKVRSAENIWLKTFSGKDNVDDLGVNGRVILKWIFDIEYEEMDLIQLAQKCVKRWTSVNTVLKLLSPQGWENS